jgi:hypothetical protein
VADEEFDVERFSRRYPSLSGLEMVETEIPVESLPPRSAGAGAGRSFRDV